jgi:hypothetical protein
MLQSLLASPEKNDPQDAQVAEMMNRDPIGFRTTANQWAHVHAGAPIQDYSQELQGGSGGATNESLKKKAAAAREAKERDARASLAEYVALHPSLHFLLAQANTSLGIVATTRTLLIAFVPWVLKCKGSCLLSSM